MNKIKILRAIINEAEVDVDTSNYLLELIEMFEQLTDGCDQECITKIQKILKKGVA